MKLAPEKRDRPVVADVGTAAAAAAAAMVAEIAASAEISKIASIHFRRRGREFGQGWIRTSEGVKPADLQSAPFGHFGTYPSDASDSYILAPRSLQLHRVSLRLIPRFRAATLLTWRFCGAFSGSASSAS